jgi:hypothetical protein
MAAEGGEMNVEAHSIGTVSSLVGPQEVPEIVRFLTTLSDPDHVDFFTIDVAEAGTMSAETWARAILEETPLARRNARVLWRLMGLRLGPRNSPSYIQGWRVAARGDNWIRAETGSWYATAQALCLVEPKQVSISLSLCYDEPVVGALVWKLIRGPHLRAVPVMLRQAAKLLEAGAIQS